MRLGIATGIGAQNAGNAELPVITATVTPTLGPLTDGDTVRSALSSGALELSNYASSAESTLDIDAEDYINRVETADGQLLESGVVTAINDFVIGLKADASGVSGQSNWDQTAVFIPGFIGRSLAGGLEGLKGSVTTNSGFVLANYDRELGLIGNETRFLRFNRLGTADPVDNNHLSLFCTANLESGAASQIWYGAYGGTFPDHNGILTVGDVLNVRIKGVETDTGQVLDKFVGFSQDSSGAEASNNGSEFAVTGGSASTPGDIEAFAPTQVIRGMNSRMVCMSAGGSVDLTAYRQRVTQFVTDVQAAIV